MKKIILPLLLLTLLLAMVQVGHPSHAQSEGIVVDRLATNLQNPRGIVVMSDGRLIVAQSGTGYQTLSNSKRTGSISIFEDLNSDGDFDDEGEIQPILTNIASYNSLTRFETGHDEVNGVGDLVLLGQQIYYTKDDPAAEITPRREYRSDTGVFITNFEGEEFFRLLRRYGTVNALGYDPSRQRFYVADSGLNVLIALSASGEVFSETQLPTLGHGQQPVPSGLTVDPSTGDILVALFSGEWRDYYDTELAYVLGDSKIVRVNPDTLAISDAVTGLTTAVDVAADPEGNIYVVEFTTVWPSTKMPMDFDRYNPDAIPDPGGYQRFTGRVTLHPADGSDPVLLADGLDQPTNITYYDGAVYVSAGQGTPNRPIIGPDGPTRITGEIYKISGF